MPCSGVRADATRPSQEPVLVRFCAARLRPYGLVISVSEKVNVAERPPLGACGMGGIPHSNRTIRARASTVAERGAQRVFRISEGHYN